MPPKRPRDPIQLAKQIGDMAMGQARITRNDGTESAWN
jgi:hypothetical protein